MADDDPSDTNIKGKRKAHAEEYGIPLDRVTYFELNPWVWAAARGLKPLPGREIPPEYRHLFESSGEAGTKETGTPEPPARESVPSRPKAQADVRRVEPPLPTSHSPSSSLEDRVVEMLRRKKRIREAFSRDDLPEH